MPSLILIRPTVWPQYTNVTDRQTGQDRQDNGPIAYGEPFYKRSPNKTLYLSRDESFVLFYVCSPKGFAYNSYSFIGYSDVIKEPEW